MLQRQAKEQQVAKCLSKSSSKQLQAKTRRLSARWTFESAQDANAMHGVDIEAEIMQALAQETAVETSIQEMLAKLRALVYS